MIQIRIQRYIVILSLVLFCGKLLAWYLTNSVMVLTDALESTVNVAAAFLGLFSITLAARPRDTNHPYGHGKAEFLSAAVEGTMIFIAGIVIIYQSIHQLLIPHQLQKLDTGIFIIAGAGLLNYLAGRYAEAQGKKSNSMVLSSAGNHMVTDAYSTIGVLIGLVLILLTNNHWPWLDSAAALCFAVIILLTGYRVLRRSISGMMDEMDIVMLKEVIEVLQKNRKPQWVDLHNLRVIQYGSMMHVDAHMTLPWYYTVAQADDEIHHLEELIKAHFNNQVELFIHIDGCMPYQCKLCALKECHVRQEDFKEQLEWKIENIWADSKHGKSLDNPQPS
jgi:cation diffusion facilitator family transporter